MRVVDLSIPLDEDVPVYPGDPRPRTCAASTVARDGFAVSRLELGSHSGTHCDAPSHFLEGAPTIDELPLERFVGEAVLVDATDVGPGRAIGRAHLEAVGRRLRPGVLVLLRTGWDAHRRDPSCFDHPFLDGDAAADLVARGVRTVGIDAINLDRTPEGTPDRATFRSHRALSEAGGVIVENLENLAALEGVRAPTVSVLPLALQGLDGAPARAVALL